MLGYEDFKKCLKDTFSTQNNGEYVLEESEILKANEKCETLTVRCQNNTSEKRITAVFYVKELYVSYRNGESIDEILEHITKSSESTSSGLEAFADMDFLKGYYKDHVQAYLVNTERNKEFLKSVVHKDFFDLSIVFSIVNDSVYDEGIASVTITHNLAKILGTDLDELLECSKKQEYQIFTLPDLLRRVSERCGYQMPPLPDEPKMFVITNKSENKGAGTIFSQGALEELASHFDRDFYLLPSSIHEFIAVDGEYDAVGYLREMVHEVNSEMVADKDLLSGSVYKCNNETLEITVA